MELLGKAADGVRGCSLGELKTANMCSLMDLWWMEFGEYSGCSLCPGKCGGCALSGF